MTTKGGMWNMLIGRERCGGGREGAGQLRW